MDEGELENLRAEAESLGVTVDRRWGAARLQTEIDAALSEPEPEPEPESEPAIALTDPLTSGISVEDGPEMPAVTVLVSSKLLRQLGEWSEPVEIRIVETPGLGTGYEMTARTAPVHRAGGHADYGDGRGWIVEE